MADIISVFDFQEDTISINHNWFNGYNISWVVSLKLVIHATERFYGYLERYFILIFLSLFCLFCQWDLLLRDYNEAKDLIEDIKDICDDFEGLCQRNLAANTGL